MLMRWLKGGHRGRFKNFFGSSSQNGFLLPMVIILGLAVGTVSVVALQSVANNSTSLNDQYYDVLAREAAKAGLASAVTCLNTNPADWTTPLLNTSCTGGGTATTVASDDNYTTTFSVNPPDRTTYTSASSTRILLTSVGKVTLKGPDGNTVKTIQQSIRSLLQVNSAPTPPTGTPTGQTSKDVDMVSTGPSTACAVAEGWAYCWGSNTTGQLGNGKNIKDDIQKSPLAVASNTAPQAAIPGVAVSCGWFCTTYNPAATPAQPASAMAGKVVTKVSVGTTHTCAVATDSGGSNGRAYCWGDNSHGQLGNESTTDTLVPVAVDTTGARATVPASGCGWFGCSSPEIPGKAASALQGKTVTDIVAGNYFTCATTSDGDISCWGENGNGQLGNDSTTDSNIPVAVSKGAAEPGRNRVCISSFFGICTAYDIPQDIPAKPASALAGKTVKALGSVKNADTMCVITNDDMGACWGENYSGQTGNGQHASNTSTTTDCSGGNSSTPPDSSFPVSNAFDVSRPAVVQTTLKFENITTFGASTSGYTVAKTSDTSANPKRMYWWGGSTTVSSKTRRACGSTGGQSGSGVNKFEWTGTRSYIAQATPAGPLYDGTTGPLDKKQILFNSGNAYNGLFCAVVASDAFCDAHGATAEQGQLGNGYSCTPSFWSPCPAQNGVKTVSRDASLSWLLRSRNITDIDTGSGYTCMVADNGIGCWGLNSSGQLGTKDTINRPYPTGVDTSEGSGLYGTTNNNGSGTENGNGNGTGNSGTTSDGTVSVLMNF